MTTIARTRSRMTNSKCSRRLPGTLQLLLRMRACFDASAWNANGCSAKVERIYKVVARGAGQAAVVAEADRGGRELVAARS